MFRLLAKLFGSHVIGSKSNPVSPQVMQDEISTMKPGDLRIFHVERMLTGNEFQSLKMWVYTSKGACHIVQDFDNMCIKVELFREY